MFVYFFPSKKIEQSKVLERVYCQLNVNQSQIVVRYIIKENFLGKSSSNFLICVVWSLPWKLLVVKFANILYKRIVLLKTFWLQETTKNEEQAVTLFRKSQNWFNPHSHPDVPDEMRCIKLIWFMKKIDWLSISPSVRWSPTLSPPSPGQSGRRPEMKDLDLINQDNQPCEVEPQSSNDPPYPPQPEQQ